MLTAVNNFVKESLSILSGEDKEGALNVLGFENYRIVIESSGNINIAVILTGKENDFLITDLREILANVTLNYGAILKDWDGVVDKIGRIGNLLNPLFTSGKYDGIYFGKIDPKTKRNLLFQNVFSGLIQKSESSPMLLCMEDLHWADPSSLALIYYITRNSSGSRLLIIGTYRPEELTTRAGVGQPLQETMQLMNREELLEKLELHRLPKECIDEIVTTMLGGTGITDDVRTLLYRETEGNPLFIIELVKFLGDEKIVIHSEGIWKLSKEISELSVPPKIYNVIGRRLNKLDMKSRELLDYASVIGETFSSFILAEALNIPRLELLSLLRDLEQKHRLIFAVNGNFRFAHAKIKEVVYSEIPTEMRMEYHSIIAKSIEKLNKDNLNDVVESLAFHYKQCQNNIKASFYLTKAANKARMNYSNTEAISFYNEALTMVSDPQRNREILDSLGEIYDLMGDYDNSLEIYNRVLALTEDPKKKADFKTKLGILYLKKGDYDKSIQQSTESLQLVKNENIKESAIALETLGYTYQRMGEYDKALKHHKKSLDIREKLGDKKGIATSYKNIGMALMDKKENSI